MGGWVGRTSFLPGQSADVGRKHHHVTGPRVRHLKGGYFHGERRDGGELELLLFLFAPEEDEAEEVHAAYEEGAEEVERRACLVRRWVGGWVGGWERGRWVGGRKGLTFVPSLGVQDHATQSRETEVSKGDLKGAGFHVLLRALRDIIIPHPIPTPRPIHQG